MSVTFIVIMSTMFVLLIISVIIFCFNNKDNNKEKSDEAQESLKAEIEAASELLNKRIDIELTAQKLEIMLTDKKDNYHIREDKSSIEFVENIIEKYNTYMNKWMIANLEILQTLDRDKLTPKLEEIEIQNCRLLLKYNHPIIVEITHLYNEITHIYDELIKKGLHYCETKINEINKKIS